jgi:S1-C subfamily serine protease
MRPSRWIAAPLVLLATLVASWPAPAAAQDPAAPKRRASARLPKLPRADNPLLAPEVLRGFFRPTVTIRKGDGRGSGTVIASTARATLVLTAAHVISDAGALQIELHPYNYGLEKDEKRLVGTGQWPRLAPAEVLASDPNADVALVRVPRLAGLPYVARVARDSVEPEPKGVFTSIGVVGGQELTGWRTDVQGSARIDLPSFTGRGTRGDPRLFTITTKPPEFGRSGGALFRPDGSIVGVCVGRLQPSNGPTVGVFASLESIHKLIRDNGVEAEMPAARPAARTTDVDSRQPARATP